MIHEMAVHAVANMPLAVTVSTPKLASGTIIAVLIGIILGFIIRGRVG